MTVHSWEAETEFMHRGYRWLVLLMGRFFFLWRAVVHVGHLSRLQALSQRVMMSWATATSSRPTL